MVFQSGLSPLARGTHIQKQYRIKNKRFIPAGAGNTVLIISQCSSITVYPRWRGEHSELIYCRGGCGGLSPLARGTRNVPIYILRIHRFIPAGAGNTLGKSPVIVFCAVYPRWRGEH
ncbi:CRISPR associated protein [Salmonella enterica subsp. enterica serovar Cerro]|nr:CRISPR associated protein of unknown function [Salmonella enterica subsp. enterica serovar Cerro]ESH23414.1 hypothetical protein SEEC0818_09262 [Salmonella enterica subsp. enterica serovar Cerro str. 818]KMN26715.1 CRISPR associated protein [Salmonella enterica subsp. enterica serovar Cerro]